MVKRSMANCAYDELCSIGRDNFGVEDFSVMTDSDVVWLSEQHPGEPRKQHIEIPREIFNRLLRAYLLERKVRKP